MKKKIQKPFDVEAAKNGAVIETKNGRSARILCYDKAGGSYPIVSLININGTESCATYTIDGKLIGIEFDEYYGEHDLVIVEEVEETKFNVGDWVFATSIRHPWLIIKVTPNYYELEDSYGYITARPHSTIDNNCRLWTLNDARPGDVLVCKNDDRPFIFKGCIDEAHPGYPTAYCGINCSGEFTSNAGQTWWTDSSVRPATYKERQQFFDRLEKEGYKWDAEALTLWKKM